MERGVISSRVWKTLVEWRRSQMRPAEDQAWLS